MPILITFEEALKLKARDLIPIKCDICDKITSQTKHSVIKIGYSHPDAKKIFLEKGRFCSSKCLGDSTYLRQTVNCKQCNKEFQKINAECIKNPNHFCSRNCAGTYNNKHKTTGFNRSKLEKYIESQLPKLFPNLKVIYNDRKTIGYELDIYIPELKLAFELNGIFHYEPIYGQDKLDKTQFNDKQKFGLCQEKLISFCVIDTTSLKYFKEEKAKVFLNIIVNIINDKLVPPEGLAPTLAFASP